MRGNQLIGYGLVVGLDGSGDQVRQTPFTQQSLTNMLSQLGITVPAGSNMQLKNVAAVMVTATLPAFARPGQTMDVVVSSMGNAKSLRGGTLLMTPLKGADSQVYAIAQGNILVGGAGASAGGSSVQINQLNGGRISGGAIIERGVPTAFARDGYIYLEMNNTDFGTAQNVVTALNRKFGQGTATALDGRVVQVRTPMEQSAQARFLSQIEDVQVARAPTVAKVIINARTGSVVMNRTVMIEEAAVAHGNLSVIINRQNQVSQPDTPFTQGDRGGAQHADRGAPGKRLAAAREHQRQPGRRGQGPERAGRHAAGPAGHPAGHEVRRRAARRTRDYLMEKPTPKRCALPLEGRRGGPAKPDPRGPVGTMDN